MRQPVLFVSHGSPMLALEGSERPMPRSLRAFAEGLPERPRGILAISAHWVTRDLRVTSSARPGVLYDFMGFPEALSRLDYGAPGDPALAARLGQVLGARLDPDRRLDHGVWTVLRHLVPVPDLPVVQVSLPLAAPEALMALGRELAPYRDEGWLILASGGLVHNLGEVDFHAPDEVAEPWALQADAWFMEHLEGGDLPSLLDHRAAWPQSRRAAPTTEHLDPVFVALGAAGPDASPRTVHAGWQLGTMGLRCLAW